jgi:23S rRNA pseudouridine1911/1915/1917 synthase
MSQSSEANERIETTNTFIVDDGQSPERIDRWLVMRMQRATRNKVQDGIDAGAVLVNGKPTKANYRVRPGDVVTVTLMKPPPIELTPQDIPLTILFEDDQFLIVDKPAGMVTHPGYGNRDGTLVNAVLHHVGGALPTAAEAARLEAEDEGIAEPGDEEEGDEESAEESEEPVDFSHVRPGIVHRLDKDTSGVMVVAKNADAQVFLARQFADRTATREYWAVVWGPVKEDEGEIEGNIARDRRDRKRFVVSKSEGKWALTRWRVIERFEYATLVALRLATGRTHQIRVHCAHIGHPIFGDPTYGGRSPVYTGTGGKHRQHVANLLKLIDRQALHARMLGVWHPTTGTLMEFTSELPNDMQALLAALRGT